MAAMKPCALCGAEPEFVPLHESDDEFAYVICSRPCGSDPSWGRTDYEAQFKWNSDQEAAELVGLRAPKQEPTR